MVLNLTKGLFLFKKQKRPFLTFRIFSSLNIFEMLLDFLPAACHGEKIQLFFLLYWILSIHCNPVQGQYRARTGFSL